MKSTILFTYFLLLTIAPCMLMAQGDLLPTASFTVSDSTLCFSFGSSNSLETTNTSENALSYQWFFEGGSPPSSTAVSPNVYFQARGIHTITLIAYNEAGSDTAISHILVDTTALVFTYGTGSPICGLGRPHYLHASCVPSLDGWDYNWTNVGWGGSGWEIAEDGSAYDTIYMPHTLTGINVTVNATDQYGCQLTKTIGPLYGTTSLEPYLSWGSINGHGFEGTMSFCQGTPLNISVNYGPPGAYGGLHCDTISSNYFSCVFQVSLLDCPPATSQNFHIQFIPYPTLNTSDTEICLGESVVLTATNLVNPIWSSNDNTFGSGWHPNPCTASPNTAGVFTYSVRNASDSGNCTSNTVTVAVSPTPTVTLTAPTSFTSDQAELACLTATSTNTTLRYVWQGLGIDTANHSNTACLLPTFDFNAYQNTLQTYTVEAIDTLTGCSRIIEKQIFIDYPTAIMGYTNELRQWLVPTANDATFTLILPNVADKVQLLIYNELGQMVYTNTYEAWENSEPTVHLPNSIPNGLYIATLQSSRQQYSSRLLISR